MLTKFSGILGGKYWSPVSSQPRREKMLASRRLRRGGPCTRGAGLLGVANRGMSPGICSLAGLGVGPGLPDLGSAHSSPPGSLFPPPRAGLRAAAASAPRKATLAEGCGPRPGAQVRPGTVPARREEAVSWPLVAGGRAAPWPKVSPRQTRAHARPDPRVRRLETRRGAPPGAQVCDHQPTGRSSAPCAPSGAQGASRHLLGARRSGQVAGTRADRA